MLKKLRNVLPLMGMVALLGGCAWFGPSQESTSAPTPANVPIVVYPADQPPRHYAIVGQVSGPTTQVLQDKARKLGADAIIAPRSVDPVSGWAMADAIKLEK